MPKWKKILEISLFAGAIYFFSIALAHQFQLKIPGLFIYYNIPSYVYQDKIISFLVFGWGVFWLAGWEQVRKGRFSIMKWILFTGIISIIGLGMVNSLTDFSSFSTVDSPFIFWLETGILFIYLLWLGFLTIKLIKPEK